MPCDGPVHFRRATTEDAAGIAQVHADGWRRAHEGLVPDEYLTCKAKHGHAEFWREELEIEDVRSLSIYPIISVMRETYEEGSFDIHPIYTKLERDEGSRELLSETALSDIIPGSKEEALRCVAAIRNELTRRRCMKIQGDIEEAERKGDSERIEELYREKHQLTSSMRANAFKAGS